LGLRRHSSRHRSKAGLLERINLSASSNDSTLFLRSTEPYVEQRILASLGKIGDPRATQPILEFLQQDLNQETRGTAIYALGDIGSPEAIAPLAELEKTEQNATLQRLAREASAKVKYHQAVLKTEAKEPLDTFLRPSEQEQQQQAPQ
jgi:HEAT repeat protein